MLRFTIITFLLIMYGITGQAQQHDFSEEDFSVINLDYPGLTKVKSAVAKKDYDKATSALLKYFRNRDNKELPGFKNFNTTSSVPTNVKEAADNALIHKFKPHKGYGYFDYGKDKINWLYLPNNEYEVKVQLHRLGWWLHMAQAYQSTKDEAYAKEFIFQFRDWNREMAYNKSKEINVAAWRPLEVCARAKVFAEVFGAFVQSPNFTPDFLMEYLKSTEEHTSYVINHYSAQGNHLLFEAEAAIKLGCYFPEFKQAPHWRESGIAVMVREVDKQVKPDGFQYEMSVNYHMAMINTFWNAYDMAKSAGLGKEFPQSYVQTIEKMALATAVICFPDYHFPMFGDAWIYDKKAMLKNFTTWSNMFPENETLKYFATNGKEGKKPDYLSKGLTTTGFYSFRNGWTDTATVMVLKASQPGKFHAQPDNGTFDLWVKGRNFTPDAGVYVYGGDAEVTALRNWYRQTRIHSTLTLDNQNMLITKADVKKWSTSANLDVLNYTNPSYDRLSHNRNVLFVDQKYFLIIDNAVGSATGNIGVHFVLKEDAKPNTNDKDKSIHTTYADGNNLLIQYLGKDNPVLKPEEGKVSYAYRKEHVRPAFVFEKQKTSAATQTFVTVLYPYQGSNPPQISVTENAGNNYENGNINVTLHINGQPKKLVTNLNQ